MLRKLNKKTRIERRKKKDYRNEVAVVGKMQESRQE